MNQDQFELTPYVDEQPKSKRGRPAGSKNAKEALVYISLRLPREVIEFFSQFNNRQAVIREALQQYIEQDRKERLNADADQ